MIFTCLNLARRPDRKLRAWHQFRREKLTVARVLAPDALGLHGPRGYRNDGARACAAAHRLAWREARRVGMDRVVVFEDDVVLCSGFAERLSAVWKVLPGDWMVLYFGCVFQTPPQIVAPGLVRVTGSTWDTHGYAIRRPLWELVGQELAGVACRSRIMDSRGDSCQPQEADSLCGRSVWKQGQKRRDTAFDVILADYHKCFPAYAAWPPMAWQIYGFSNNENVVRGNYMHDGTQHGFRDAIRHLPAVDNYQ